MIADGDIVMQQAPFSKRFGYHVAAPINVREDAPDDLRAAVLQIGEEEGLTPHLMRATVCRLLRTREDPNNWSAYPNVWEEVNGLVASCPWYRVYDVAEAIYADLASGGANGKGSAQGYEAKLNEFFGEQGIGWKMVEGRIETRGDEAFELAVKNAKDALATKKAETAAAEIQEALRDLSRRPDPDRTGAIQHAMAALECFARQVAGDPKPTLGDLLKRYRDKLGIPEPLHTAIEKAWGYTSEVGRHLREGREPGREEAELVVTVCAGLITFLSAKVQPDGSGR